MFVTVRIRLFFFFYHELHKTTFPINPTEKQADMADGILPKSVGLDCKLLCITLLFTLLEVWRGTLKCSLSQVAMLTREGWMMTMEALKAANKLM